MLKSETVKEMWTAIPAAKVGDGDTHYGLGWFIGNVRHKDILPNRKERLIYHTGGAMGASSMLMILPDEGNPTSKGNNDLVFALIINSSCGVTELSRKILDIFRSVEADS